MSADRAAAVGMFDGVHLGHQALVRDVCAHAGEHGLEPVIFTFGTHPMSLIAPERAPRLLTTPEQKQSLLRQAGASQVYMLTFDEQLRSLSAADFLSMLHSRWQVRLLVVGFNHHFGRDRQGTFDDYRRMGQDIGIEVVKSGCEVIEHADGRSIEISSSAIRTALGEGRLDLANDMLGRPYAIAGSVEHGLNIGTKIGFPTANVRPDMDCQQWPADGVYAARVEMPGGEQAMAMVNIGKRPTLGDGRDRTIEANILDYQGTLYGQQLTVRFVRRIRDERKFDSMQALADQIARDRQAVYNALI